MIQLMSKYIAISLVEIYGYTKRQIGRIMQLRMHYKIPVIIMNEAPTLFV